MSIASRVGRIEGRIQCQNSAQDQGVVTDLLNRIPGDRGGKHGGLTAPIVDGTCGDDLWLAIMQFEQIHFGSTSNGYVDPGSPLLRHMEELAAKGEGPLGEPKSPLYDALRRNLRDDSVIRGVWTAGERVKFDQLVTDALRWLDAYKDEDGDVTLPSRVLMFGTAYLDSEEPNPVIAKNREGNYDLFFSIYGGMYRGSRGNWGMLSGEKQVHPLDYITTQADAALLLYDTGNVLRVRRYHTGHLNLPEWAFRTANNGYLRPVPGAMEAGLLT